MSIRSTYVVGDSISIQYGLYLRTKLRSGLGYDRSRKAGESADDLGRPRSTRPNRVCIGQASSQSSRLHIFTEEVRRLHAAFIAGSIGQIPTR